MSEFKKAVEEKRTQKANNGGRCALCQGVLGLPKKKIADFYEAMLDTNIDAPTILEVLAKWKVHTSLTTINNHRAGRKGLSSHMAVLKKAATTQ